MVKQSNIIQFISFEGTPVLYLFLITDNETNFIIGDSVYTWLIAKYFDVMDECLVAFGEEAIPPISCYLNENGVRQFFPESNEFQRVNVLDLSGDGIDVLNGLL